MDAKPTPPTGALGGKMNASKASWHPVVAAGQLAKCKIGAKTEIFDITCHPFRRENMAESFDMVLVRVLRDGKNNCFGTCLTMQRKTEKWNRVPSGSKRYRLGTFFIFLQKASNCRRMLDIIQISLQRGGKCDEIWTNHMY